MLEPDQLVCGTAVVVAATSFAVWLYANPGAWKTISERVAAIGGKPVATAPDRRFVELTAKLGVPDLPAEIARRADVGRDLDLVGREPCDREAVFTFSDHLALADYRREGANVLVSLSERCAYDGPALEQATNMLMDLGNYAASYS